MSNEIQKCVDVLEIEIRELLRRDEAIQQLITEKAATLGDYKRLQKQQLESCRLTPPGFTYLEIEKV